MESMLILRHRAERCEKRRIMNRIEDLGAKNWKGVDLNTLARGTWAEVCANFCFHVFICMCARSVQYLYSPCNEQVNRALHADADTT